jgi:hypothetical protein
MQALRGSNVAPESVRFVLVLTGVLATLVREYPRGRSRARRAGVKRGGCVAHNGAGNAGCNALIARGKKETELGRPEPLACGQTVN